MRGPATKIIYNMISCYWKTPNSKEFVNSPSFKIITSDPLDDTIDLFANLHVGVAEICAKRDYYSSPVYKRLFESLVFIYQQEHILDSKVQMHVFEIRTSVIEMLERVSNDISRHKSSLDEIEALDDSINTSVDRKNLNHCSSVHQSTDILTEVQ